MQSRRTTVIAIILAILILAGFIALVVYTNMRNKGTGTVTLYSAPDDMTMLLDGKKVNANGTYHVKAGSHTLKASFTHFISKTSSFSLKVGEKKTVQLYLSPADDEGRNYLSLHPDQDHKISGISGAQTQQKYDQAQQKITFLNELPWIDQYYRIDYGASQKNPNDTNAVAIYITYYSDAGKQQALQWIQNHGYDPSKLEIIYQLGDQTFEQ